MVTRGDHSVHEVFQDESQFFGLNKFENAKPSKVLSNLSLLCMRDRLFPLLLILIAKSTSQGILIKKKKHYVYYLPMSSASSLSLLFTSSLTLLFLFIFLYHCQNDFSSQGFQEQKIENVIFSLGLPDDLCAVENLSFVLRYTSQFLQNFL